ncbi:MAG: polyketide cyclase [Niabella sp.]|nr:MAG: polyketide cyclase [Niabella sp.]
MNNQPITITAIVKAPIKKVWEFWNTPQHISGWAFASDDWEAPYAENDLRMGGTFKTRMQSKANPSEGFDFNGTYTQVLEDQLIEYDMEKGPQEEKSRHVKTEFEKVPDGVKITQTFDPENENPIDMQRQGWQAILNNFKTYTEAR